MFELPEEIRNEIFSYLQVRDVMNVYKAYYQKSTTTYLNYLARINQLPYGTSFSILVRFQEELEVDSRIKYCIKNNDIDSFIRLYPLCETSDHIDYLINTELKENRKPMVRPEIVYVILLHLIKENYQESLYGKENMMMLAMYHKQFNLFEMFLSQGYWVEMCWIREANLTEPHLYKIFTCIADFGKEDEEFWTDVAETAICWKSVRILELAFKNEASIDCNCLGYTIISSIPLEILRVLVDHNTYNNHVIEMLRKYDDVDYLQKTTWKEEKIDPPIIAKEVDYLLIHQLKTTINASSFQRVGCITTKELKRMLREKGEKTTGGRTELAKRLLKLVE